MQNERPSTLYRVVWEIDINAETPEEAANIAHTIQQDTESTATVFTVFKHHDDSNICTEEDCENDICTIGDIVDTNEIKHDKAHKT